MKQITIVSGKGGTGKTTITASFAALARRVVVADCDVDAAVLHLLLDPRVITEQEFKGSKLASIDKVRCANCGLCQTACRFGAIRNLEIDPMLCEGCGVCAYVCPARAISLRERVAGRLYTSETRFGPMSHARLHAAEANSGKLVTLVRHKAKQLADREGLDLILADGPPGIGCPVIASLTGVDMAIIVTEATMSGLHDLRRILSLVRHFKMTSSVIINMWDINQVSAERISQFCEQEGIKVLARIPFDLKVTEAMVAGKPVVEYSPDCVASGGIRTAWDGARDLLGISSGD